MGKVTVVLEVDEGLAERVREAGLDVSHLAEVALTQALSDIEPGVAETGAPPIASGTAEDRARAWSEENADAIRDYNERIARRGPFGGDLRRW